MYERIEEDDVEGWKRYLSLEQRLLRDFDIGRTHV
jgi:hypothetical protein